MKEFLKRAFPTLIFISAPCAMSALIYHWISAPVDPSPASVISDTLSRPELAPRARHRSSKPASTRAQDLGPSLKLPPVSLRTFLEQESHGLSDPSQNSESPELTERRLNAQASSLSSSQIRTLGRLVASSRSQAHLRMLAVDLLSRNGSGDSLRALEQATLRFKHLGHRSRLSEETRFEASLALWIIDSLARQSDQALADASLKRLARQGNLLLVRHYLARVLHAVESGRVQEFYERQDKTLKLMAGTV